METRNITLSLPADLIREAKIYAAQHDTTINTFVKELLQEVLSRDSRTRAAVKRLLEISDGGPWFTGDISAIRRDDIYERR